MSLLHKLLFIFISEVELKLHNAARAQCGQMQSLCKSYVFSTTVSDCRGVVCQYSANGWTDTSNNRTLSSDPVQQTGCWRCDKQHWLKCVTSSWKYRRHNTGKKLVAYVVVYCERQKIKEKQQKYKSISIIQWVPDWIKVNIKKDNRKLQNTQLIKFFKKSLNKVYSHPKQIFC